MSRQDHRRVYIVDRILEARKRRQQWEYLIQWLNYPDTTWETTAKLADAGETVKAQMVAARQTAEDRSRRAPPAASSSQEAEIDVASPSVSEPDPAPFVPYYERPSTRRTPAARVRALQELPTPRAELDSSTSDVFWMQDIPPELRDCSGPYTEAELDHHRQQATAALRSATRSPDSALQALTTNLCPPSSVYTANDVSNDYFSQLESIFALFSDP